MNLWALFRGQTLCEQLVNAHFPDGLPYAEEAQRAATRISNRSTTCAASKGIEVVSNASDRVSKFALADTLSLTEEPARPPFHILDVLQIEQARRPYTN